MNSSIYRDLLEDKKDLSKYLATEDQKDTEELLKAVLDYYERDRQSILEFTNYFKTHRVESVWQSFLERLSSLEDFKEDKLVGLSILLMRDTYSVEGIKFGMLLSELYNLNNVPAAFKIMADLAVLDEFYETAMRVLKNVRIFPVIRDSIERKRNNEIR